MSNQSLSHSFVTITGPAGISHGHSELFLAHKNGQLCFVRSTAGLSATQHIDSNNLRDVSAPDSVFPTFQHIL